MYVRDMKRFGVIGIDKFAQTATYITSLLRLFNIDCVWVQQKKNEDCRSMLSPRLGFACDILDV